MSKNDKSEQATQKFIGERIKIIRTQKGISQQKLYEETGIVNTLISAYENGSKNIGLDNLLKIAKGLKVSLDELCYGDNSESFIKTAPNTGRKITNCIFELYKEHVVTGVVRDKMDNSAEFRINRHIEPISKFVRTLNQNYNKKDISGYREYMESIKEATSYEINVELEEMKKEQERMRALQNMHF